jgi:hypothetical protein
MRHVVSAAGRRWQRPALAADALVLAAAQLLRCCAAAAASAAPSRGSARPRRWCGEQHAPALRLSAVSKGDDASFGAVTGRAERHHAQTPNQVRTRSLLTRCALPRCCWYRASLRDCERRRGVRAAWNSSLLAAVRAVPSPRARPRAAASLRARQTRLRRLSLPSQAAGRAQAGPRTPHTCAGLHFLRFIRVRPCALLSPPAAGRAQRRARLACRLGGCRTPARAPRTARRLRLSPQRPAGAAPPRRRARAQPCPSSRR